MSTNRIALASLALTALAALDLRSAAAGNRPWCFQDTGKSATSCAFTSFEQCMMTARGLGGICKQNPSYPQYGERSPARDDDGKLSLSSGRRPVRRSAN
jgi:hypothetical protein